VLRILTRCSTSFRFAPCLAPISQVFQPSLVSMSPSDSLAIYAQNFYKIFMGQHTSGVIDKLVE